MSEEASKTTLLDVERLQQLSYERSTKWANFLDSIAVSDSPEVININDLEDLYDEDPEDVNDLASMEDDSCDDKSIDSDVLRDITNTTRLALMFSSHNRTSKMSDATIIQDENHELVDLFNQTMPVINEHNRQMKESGFDRILNTFDAKKIEEKVGGWLRRHNSLCTPDYTAAAPVDRNSNWKENPYPVELQTVTCRPYRSYRDDDTDSDDSFHSGETARYIRSSRLGALKNSSSTTMMIKTYRMVKSTRQALKDKYACAYDDDAELHLNKLRHRRRIANEVEFLHSNKKHSARAHKPKNQYITPIHSTQKRKLLRKRSASNSCSAVDTSSESDNAYSRGTSGKYYHQSHTCCGQRHRFTGRRHAAISSDVAASVKRSVNRIASRTPYSCRNHVYYHSHSISSSSSLSPSAPFTINTCKKRGRKCIDKRGYNDCRPYKLESECRCCNEKRVCQEYTHLADTSTDEWFVENSYTSKKFLDTTPPSEKMPFNSTTTKKCSISGITSIIDDAPTTSTASHNVDSTPAKSSKASTKPSKKKTQKSKEVSDDSFETELQIALKASEESYQKEMSKKKRMKLNEKHEKPLVKTSNDSTVVEKPHLKRLPTEDALTAVGEVCQKSCKLKDSSEDNTVFRKHHTKWNSLTTNASIQGSEDTFFAASTKVCNSTALPNNKPAGQRQIDGDTAFLNAHQTETTKKRATTPVREVLRNTVYGEDIDEDTTKPVKHLNHIPKVKENDAPVKLHTTKQSINSSIDINPDEESCKHKVDNTRPKNTATSTKLRKLNNKGEIIDNDGFVFAKPRAHSKNISKTKSDTKPGTGTATNISVTRVDKNATAVEFEEQTIKGNENSNNVEQTTPKSNKKKQGNKILPAEISYKEQLNNNNQENYADSEELCKENAKHPVSLTEVKKPKTKLLIISNILIDKSLESDENIKAKIKHSMSKIDLENNEDCSFVKQRYGLASKSLSPAGLDNHSVQNSSTRVVKFKDDSQKQHFDITDFSPRMLQNNRQSKNKIKVTDKKTSGTKKPNNSNVSSTTVHKHLSINNSIISISADENENDCTVVSSTTNIDPHVPPTGNHTDADATSTSRQNKTTSSSHTTFSKSRSQQQEASYLASTTQNRSTSHHPKKGILIYTPKNPSLAPAQSFSNDGCFFQITKEHLSSVIGEKPAEKFLKYYIGRRRFNKNSTIYFKPPAARVLDTNDASSSDSDDDLESIGQYGDLYESVGAATGGNNNETDNGTHHS